MEEDKIVPGYYMDKETKEHIQVLFTSSHFSGASGKIVEFVKQDPNVHFYMHHSLLTSCLYGTSIPRFEKVEYNPWK